MRRERKFLSAARYYWAGAHFRRGRLTFCERDCKYDIGVRFALGPIALDLTSFNPRLGLIGGDRGAFVMKRREY